VASSVILDPKQEQAMQQMAAIANQQVAMRAAMIMQLAMSVFANRLSTYSTICDADIAAEALASVETAKKYLEAVKDVKI